MKDPGKGKAFWHEHCEKFKLSGDSRVQYCRDHGLKYSVFLYWLRKLGFDAVTKPSFIPVQLKSVIPGVSAVTSHQLLCALETRCGVIKIYDAAALSVVLDRVMS